jgi:lysophospholipase L1-like esterase
MRAGLVAAAINAVAIGLYIWLEAAIPFVPLPKWLVFCLAMTVVLGSALIAAAIGKRASHIVSNLQLSLTSCIAALAMFELLFRLFPTLFPDNLRALVETGISSQQARKAVVELLPHSPFAKPHANVDVFIPGYYGPKDSFVYEWRSDRRGFKNLPGVAAYDKVKAVALGDSFTEGMGVATADTWTSRLSAKGHTTYNLGIQGYAPTQFHGAYHHYGRKLAPEWVIVGILGNVYTRERAFLATEQQIVKSWSEGGMPQAIGRLADRDRINQDRPLYFETKDGYRFPLTVAKRRTFLTSAAAVLAYQQVYFWLYFDIKGGVASSDSDERFVSEPQKSNDVRVSLMARYRQEIVQAATVLDAAALQTDPHWKSMERAIERIIQASRQDDAKVVLAFFPNRGTTYYERSSGRRLPEHAFDLVQAQVLRAFAAKHDVHFIDFLPVLRRSIDKLTENDPITVYPYLKVDGHLSPAGHEIVAAELAAFLAAVP